MADKVLNIKLYIPIELPCLTVSTQSATTHTIYRWYSFKKTNNRRSILIPLILVFFNGIMQECKSHLPRVESLQNRRQLFWD